MNEHGVNSEEGAWRAFIETRNGAYQKCCVSILIVYYICITIQETIRSLYVECRTIILSSLYYCYLINKQLNLILQESNHAPVKLLNGYNEFSIF